MKIRTTSHLYRYAKFGNPELAIEDGYALFQGMIYTTWIFVIFALGMASVVTIVGCFANFVRGIPQPGATIEDILQLAGSGITFTALAAAAGASAFVLFRKFCGRIEITSS